mmetsp:Transcript_14313/g.39256  ORF Transcript_14313/g.39256 Transcript_14313/m.39256 type:complete len:243 (+) Transcript_14313:553-1281(+)
MEAVVLHARRYSIAHLCGHQQVDHRSREELREALAARGPRQHGHRHRQQRAGPRRGAAAGRGGPCSPAQHRRLRRAALRLGRGRPGQPEGDSQREQREKHRQGCAAVGVRLADRIRPSGDAESRAQRVGERGVRQRAGAALLRRLLHDQGPCDEVRVPEDQRQLGEVELTHREGARPDRVLERAAQQREQVAPPRPDAVEEDAQEDGPWRVDEVHKVLQLPVGLPLVRALVQLRPLHLRQIA